MELGEAGLQEQPFRTHGRPLVFVRYSAQQTAFGFLTDTYAHDRGLGLFQGPSLSGKTTIIRHFAESLTNDAAVAVVDGAGMNTTGLLEAMLSQYGYDLQFSSVNELLSMVKVFVLQQTAANHAPLLVVENTHALNPSALRVLCELAGLKVRTKCALRLILASDRSISSMIKAPAMETILKRLTGDFHLAPLSISETTDYVHAKLRAGGCFDPLSILPVETCDEIHFASGGWPGVIDRLVTLAMSKAPQCPIDMKYIERPLAPSGTPALVVDLEKSSGNGSNGSNGTQASGPAKLFLTYNGRTLREIDVDRPRILIGRSDHNDVCVNSRFISRHHALFVRQGAATFLMDLNSTNGTYVNSQRVSNHVLAHDDVISIGNHGIKFYDPNAQDSVKLEGVGFDDTAIMKNLRDMRKLLAREKTQSTPTAPRDHRLASDTGPQDVT
jgi:type II secretory pathway predicted ATPase ExeA/pSer/pThr/pTyr-binding forkhead associated (FHA) protein